jgi:hypothetical protein
MKDLTRFFLRIVRALGSKMKVILTPSAFSYSASRYKKSCFVFQLNRGVRSSEKRDRQRISNAWTLIGEMKVTQEVIRIQFG